MNKPLMTLGLSMIVFSVFLIWEVAHAQEVEVTTDIRYTAQDQAYWTVNLDGTPVSQHTTQREAYEEANRQIELVDFEEERVKVIHIAVIDIEGTRSITYLDENPEPNPIPTTIEIPGGDSWVPAPGDVQQFTVLNDTYAVTSNNLWLYVFKVATSDGTEGFAIRRPEGIYRGDLVQSETTPLTDEQVVELITALASTP